MQRLERGRFFGHHVSTGTHGSLHISETTYQPRERIPQHYHDHPYLCVVMAGGFVEKAGGRSESCMRGAIVWHNAGHVHRDDFGSHGGRCLNVQFSEPDAWEAAHGFKLPQDWTMVSQPVTAMLGARISSELASPDALSPLAVEALLVSMLTAVHRSAASSRVPCAQWLGNVLEELRSVFRGHPSVVALAQLAGVHPAYLSRVFHRAVGMTIPEYVRKLRIEWASEQLANTDLSISMIALQAGFADQAHFTRAFRRVAGTTPARYRSRVRY